MPNTEIVRALVNAFNVHNYARDTVETNFTLQSEGKKNYIVVSFDKSMDTYQCSRYLDSIKRKIIREFYGIEESNDAEILDTAKLIFDVNSFPFDISDRDWSWDKQHGFKFVTPVDKGVIFNLKSHLAASLAKDVIEDMPTCNIRSSDRKDYLWQGEFDNKELRKQFEREFLSRMRERYENVPKNPLKIEGNSVYIRDVFDDARFIDSVTRRAAWLTGMGFHADSKVRSDVKAFKDLIIRFIDQSTEIMLTGFVCASPLDREEASVLMPIILEDKEARLLIKKEADKLNQAFDDVVFRDVNGRTQAKLSVNGSSEVYGIDFSNPYISHCVITKIIESSVINKDHELSIDPELVRALSPAQSPVRVPNGPSSGLTELSSPTQEFPSRSQSKGLEGSPRQGSGKEKEGSLFNHVNSDGPSKGFSPSPQMNSTAVSQRTGKCVSAAKNVQAGSSAWSSPASSAGLWSLPQSRPSSWKGANPVGTSPWAQQTNPYLSQGTSENKWQSLQFTEPGLSGLSWNSAAKNVQAGSSALSQPMGSWSSQSSNVKEDCKKIHEVFEGAYKKIVSGSSLSEEEEKLFKALLYVFNLNNHILECPHTNFIVKNGKIASSINDGVDVKEYLKEVIDKTKEEYRVNKKEAYDLNEFPFKFLSNCEKNQETTVVANISRGALFNLKKLFIQEQKPKKKVKIEDININIVEEAVKSKKKEWVDSQVREHGFPLKAAIESCYPDESALKHISIIKDKGGYQIDHAYDSSEVKSLKKQLCTKGKSKAEKMKSEDNKDSGYSSGFVTDAENVSSKAEATTSGYESIDCENTGGGSPKRRSQSPVGEGNPRKSPKRGSSPLSRLESLSLSSSSHQIGKC